MALWQRTDPAFVLGSMLPDFAGMARAKLAPTTASSGPVVDGIALHHRTDDVFHASPIFVRLLQETLDELTTLGVARGTARAIGHVGTEMFIDGELLRSPEVAAAYTRALNAGDALGALFADADAAARWELLRKRLIVYGAPYDYGEPESVLHRLTVVLRGRPRLAIDDLALPALRQALPGLQRKVVDQLSELLAGLRAHLS